MTFHQFVLIMSVNGVESLTAMLNALASMVIIFVCICRARQMHKGVLVRVKLAYLGLIMGAFTNAVSPGLGELPGWCSITFTLAVLVMLFADSFQWRNGPPKSTTEPASLGFY
jgi:hypothetical protein